ncbi:amidohydrolase family protein [Amycolatopsis sp. FDAARGOS 1241]|uniref:amidohydrolase family protein n=1 Tax=Amycolatopsis sp. FDAARGOS 1241 TaxID=2778070 RepID=UPI00195231EF|nr:amidohydrolase family protein [Amycolatopsis sp. FDAARGOS 1241]QRP49759.1 amidohydrolase family protein [Amycolatopsis sp. FDAARGOS 1241]
MTAFTADEGWLSYDPDPSKPEFLLPPGTVDVHTHVFGPGDTFPYAPERKYTPTDASKEQLFALRDFLGIDRQVIVQATCHGADNSALVDALAAAGERARGIATIRGDEPDEELARLHAAGVRGIRLNFVRRLVDPKPDAYYHDLAARITPLGWHLVVYFEAADLAEKWDFFTSLPTTVLVDHMGRPDVTKPVDGPEFGRFRTLLREHPNFHVKVTGPERLTVAGPPYDDVVPFGRALVEEFPDRVLWGTDWPHPNMKSHMPDDGKLVDFVPRIAPTDEARRKLLITNPMRLYWGE